MSQVTEEQAKLLAQAMQLLQSNPNVAKQYGYQFVPKARVNVSADENGHVNNLLFSEGNGKVSGALGWAGDSLIYMASRRLTGRFQTMPLSVSKVNVTKDNKLHIEIDYQLLNDAERSLVNAYLQKKAMPTLPPKKPRQTRDEQLRPTTQIGDNGSSTQVSAPVAQTSVPATSSAPELTILQKATMDRAIELGLYKDATDAMAKFDQWKNITPKQLG
jgi:hypothetical protein